MQNKIIEDMIVRTVDLFEALDPFLEKQRVQ